MTSGGPEPDRFRTGAVGAGRYRLEASGMTALSRMTARLSALRAASALGRRSMAASCAYRVSMPALPAR